MIILIAAAFAVAAPAAPSAPADPHAKHQQQGKQHESHACCCKDMAKAEPKMECCDRHGEGQRGEHAGHDATR